MILWFVRRWGKWIVQCENVYVTQRALLCVGLGLRFTEITLRYLYDVAQGTAIPRWAFFNVTVCYLSTLASTELRGLTLYLNSQSLPDQTFNDTVAMAIDRKSGTSSYTPLCF